MNLTLRIWRQSAHSDTGAMVNYQLDGIEDDMSFLEMLDVLNEQLTAQNEDPVAFDHDCREGICGTCSLVIDGIAHGPQAKTAVCQLHMRHFSDGDSIDIEPWRSESFPIIKDLIVDRSALDRIVESGGYISASTGSAPDAHATPVPKSDADRAFDASICIGCGACVAACPNGSAMLFTGAKATHLGALPQGQPERNKRAQSMVEQHDAEGFGGCTQIGECEAVCPAGIPLETISQLNADLLGSFMNRDR